MSIDKMSVDLNKVFFLLVCVIIAKILLEFLQLALKRRGRNH